MAAGSIALATKASAIAGSLKSGSGTEIKALQLAASKNLSLARGRYVEENGIASIFKPRFWILWGSQVTTANFFPISLAVIFFLIFLMWWLYGTIHLFYMLYVLKTIPMVIANTILTIGNAVWFAFHGLTMLIINGIITIINAIAYFFLEPFARAIAHILHLPVISYIAGMPDGSSVDVWVKEFMENALISWPSGFDTLQPEQAFAYMVPEPLQFDSANKDFVWESLWGYKWVKPGVDIYTGNMMLANTGKDFGGSLVRLYYPQINPDAVAEGFWTDLPDVTPYVYDFSRIANNLTSWGQIFAGFGDMLGSAVDTLGGAIDWLLNFFAPAEDFFSVETDFPTAGGPPHN